MRVERAARGARSVVREGERRVAGPAAQPRIAARLKAVMCAVRRSKPEASNRTIRRFNSLRLRSTNRVAK